MNPNDHAHAMHMHLTLTFPKTHGEAQWKQTRRGRERWWHWSSHENRDTWDPSFLSCMLLLGQREVL